MSISARVAPPNSLVLVLDPSGGTIPASLNGELIAATDSCLAIGCRAEDDGETEFILGNSDSIGRGERPAFEGTLKTPSRKIAVRSVLGTMILEMPVPSGETMVRVWVNDPQEPDCITIGIS
jgi:hypothetical protein